VPGLARIAITPLDARPLHAAGRTQPWAPTDPDTLRQVKAALEELEPDR
jgi:hypothetical protein